MASITETYPKHALHFPEKIAIHTHNEKINYQSWHELVWKTANWLDSHHLSNHTLGILMPNGIPFLQLFTGAATAGWTTVFFDLKWTEHEWKQRLALAQPSIVVTTKELYSKIKHLHSNVIIWEDCSQEIENLDHFRTSRVDDSHPFYMGFTSGTTGDPKAFIRGHDSWVASFVCTDKNFHINEKDQVLIPGPLIHSHFLYGAISTMYLGATLYLLEKFSAASALSLLKTEPITVIYVVPTMIAAFLREEMVIDQSIKVLSSGAKWEGNSKQQIRRMFPHFTMYEFYGASELSFVTFLTDEENHRKPDSVGKPCHQVEIQIRQKDSALAKPFEPGKIYVRSNMLFIGYIDSRQEIHSIRDEEGWITVGDMGYLDDEGFLYIAGREKNMIIYGGINIFPEEIEKVIGEHPEVDEAAVIGLSDPYWGQIVTAVIKGAADKKDLKVFCRKHLSSYKVPRKWIFIEEMPYTTSGKIARPQLKALIESKVMSH